MKKMRLFWSIVKRTGLNKCLIGFFVCFFLFSLILYLVDGNINSYPDALWYLFVSCTSIGFGDIVVSTVVGRILTVLITVYEIMLIAMMSGVVVSNYLEIVNIRKKESTTMFLDKLEHLTELSHDELAEIESKVKKIK